MIGAAALLLSTALVFWAAALCARIAGTAPGVERVLAVATLAGVGVIVCSLLAGFLHVYTALGVTVVAALVAVAAALAHRILLGPLPRPTLPRLPALRPWQLVLAVLAGLALAWRVVLALVLPPFAFDSLTYHATAVAHWVESRTIGANTYSFCCALYPSNGEVLHGWLAVFTHTDTLVDASQIGTACLGAIAVAALARWIGVTPGGALAAGALFLVTPIVLTQADTPYVDVTFSAFLLAGAALLVRFLDADPFQIGHGQAGAVRPGLLALAGLAAGAALGAKHFALPAVAVLAALLAGHLVAARLRRRMAISRALVLLLVFAACCVLVGGSWYVRSWSEKRNPVWPAAVHVGHTTVFAGRRQLGDLLTVPPGGNRAWPYEVARSWAHDLAFWTRRDYSYEERDGGLGPVWSWLGLPALLVLAWWAIRRRPDVAVNLLAPFALLYAVQPYRWWSRFTIYLPALAAPAIVLGIEQLRNRALSRALAVATVLLAVIGVGLATWRLDPSGRARVIDVRDVLGLVDAPARERTSGALFFPEYAWLGRIPLDAPVAIEEFAPSIRFVYPFLAPRFERRVDLLTGSPGPYTAHRLARDRIRFLAVERGGAFDRWARAQPSALVPFSNAHGVRVFRARGGAYSLRP